MPSQVLGSVERMRSTGYPIGLLVYHGGHAWTMIGFTATADPALTPHYQVTGVYVAAPFVAWTDPRPGTYYTTSQIRAGVMIAGRYRVIDRLGHGGMATVFLAEDLVLSRQVAVKRLHVITRSLVASIESIAEPPNGPGWFHRRSCNTREVAAPFKWYRPTENSERTATYWPSGVRQRSCGAPAWCTGPCATTVSTALGSNSSGSVSRISFSNAEYSRTISPRPATRRWRSPTPPGT